MPTKVLMVVLASLLLNSSVLAGRIAGIDLPETMIIDGQSLGLNGAGIRTNWFLKVYVGGLYLLRDSQDPAAITGEDQAMAIRLHMVSGMVNRKRMVGSIQEGFKKSAGTRIKDLEPDIDRFIGFFKEEISKNDIFDLVYHPRQGLKVFKNQVMQGVIPGLDFKQALFGIWLGSQPVDASLKADMLGN